MSGQYFYDFGEKFLISLRNSIIGDLTVLYILTCNDFYDLSAWGGCWFVVYIRRFIYKFLNVCPFD